MIEPWLVVNIALGVWLAGVLLLATMLLVVHVDDARFARKMQRGRSR